MIGNMFHTTAYNFSEIKWLKPGDVNVCEWNELLLD